jgi:hypothetical protein
MARSKVFSFVRHTVSSPRVPKTAEKSTTSGTTRAWCGPRKYMESITDFRSGALSHHRGDLETAGPTESVFLRHIRHLWQLRLSHVVPFSARFELFSRLECDGNLFDLLNAWIPEDALTHRILVDNPAELYGFAQDLIQRN